MSNRWACLILGPLIWAGLASPATAQPPRTFRDLRHWVYQLEGAAPTQIAGSGFDLAVIDYSRDGTEATAFTPAEVAQMQRKPDGSPRFVVSYLSIGEAEAYRYYWDPAWRSEPPGWMEAENPDWPGNYKVRYWDPAWQRIIFGAPESYLDKIMAAGFDGVYLDIIDAFEYFEAQRPAARQEMITFVRRISQYAKSKNPDFLIIPQNGELLLQYPDFLAAIDGIAKEDLFYGYAEEGRPSPPEEIAFSTQYLEMARKAGRPVLTVDYVSAREKVEEVYQKSRQRGYIPYASIRALDRLVFHPGLDPGPAPTAAETPAPARGLGRYASTTAPRGAFRSHLALEYASEKFEYWYDDFQPVEDGPDTPYQAEAFYELTTTLAVYYGLTDQWELGLAVPLVSGHFEKDPQDNISGLESTYDELALGDVRVLLAHGRTWDEGAQTLKFESELTLPTDGREDPFPVGNGAFRMSLTGESYGERFGLIGGLAGNYYREKEVNESTTSLEFQAGFGLQLTEAVHFALLAGREFMNKGENISRLELGLEFTLSPNRVLEISAGTDLNGPAQAFFLSTGLWF